MSKKYLLYILPVLILMLIAGFLYYKKSTSTLSFKESQLFEFDSTQIKSIRFESGNTSLRIEKLKGKWMVNNTFTLDPAKFTALYAAHNRLAIQSPASGQIIERLESLPDERKIKVYMDISGKKRAFVMVYDSQGQTGTYVTVPGREQYFQVFLPGYPRKDLTYLYPLSASFWRDRTLVAIEPDQIQKISVTYPSRPLASFELNLCNDSVHVSNLQISLPSDKINRDNVSQYLGYYARVQFNSILDTLPNKKVMNILKSQPEAVISLQTNDKKKITMQVFNKTMDSDESQLDPNHVYIKHSDFEEMLLTSFVEIAPLLKRMDYFM